MKYSFLRKTTYSVGLLLACLTMYFTLSSNENGWFDDEIEEKCEEDQWEERYTYEERKEIAGADFSVSLPEVIIKQIPLSGSAGANAKFEYTIETEKTQLIETYRRLCDNWGWGCEPLSCRVLE